MIQNNKYYIELLKENWEKEKGNLKPTEFCRKYNISHNYFYKRIQAPQKSYKTTQKVKAAKAISNDEIKEIKRLYNEENMDFEEIAKKGNYDLGYIYSVLYRDWQKKQFEKYWDNDNNFYSMSIKEMIKKGLTLKDIADMFSFEKNILSKFVISKGYYEKPKRYNTKNKSK